MEQNEVEISCFDEGANGYWDGKELGDNPYPAATIKWECWRDGWITALREVEG